MKPTFGGHEKFTIRHGWLKKGVDAVNDQSRVFADDNALITLGVGKNMVRSIRHWCLTTRVIAEAEGEARELAVTPLGKRLLLASGWDPYLEDVGSLWLIHWLLCANRVRALVWQFAFSAFYEPEFSKQTLTSSLTRYLERSNVSTTAGTIQREIDCFLHTYVTSPRKGSDAVSEETLGCPLTELDLIRFSHEGEVYLFNIGPKPTLPVEIFGYSLLEYFARIASNRQTLGVDECLYKGGSPGLMFRLDENSVVSYLEELGRITEGKIQIEETAGLRQVYMHVPVEQMSDLKMNLLDRYYAAA